MIYVFLTKTILNFTLYTMIVKILYLCSIYIESICEIYYLKSQYRIRFPEISTQIYVRFGSGNGLRLTSTDARQQKNVYQIEIH